MEKALLEELKGRRASRCPIWLMRQAGRYLPEYREVRAKAGDFLSLCYTPSLAAEVTLQPLRRFDLDAAIIFADILLVPHALGQKVWFAEGEGPKLEPVDVRGLSRLGLGSVATHLAPVYDAVARVRAALPAGKALIGFAGSPWTVATYMAEGGGSSDQRAAKLWAYRDPSSFAALIGLLEEATIFHLSAQIEAGAEAVQLFDTWAGSLACDGFAEWVVAPTRRIVKALKAKHPDVPVIGFPRGAGASLPGYARDTGVDVVGLDTSVDPVWARAAIPHGIALQGNLDPLLLVAGGRAMEARARAIIAALSAGPFVFNLGHGIVPETPPENVQRLVDLVHGTKQ